MSSGLYSAFWFGVRKGTQGLRSRPKRPALIEAPKPSEEPSSEPAETFDLDLLAESDLSLVRRSGLLGGRYELIDEIGCGGMGRVYRAEDHALGNEVIALKILHPQFCRDTRVRSRFIREVRLMRTITSLNIVRTYDVGISDDELFLTMEFVNGTSLVRLIAEDSLTLEDRLDVAQAICRGLSAIHEKDIIHRDIKPANILVDINGNVKITDFGLARPLASQMTMCNEIMGSLSYIAPEVVVGQEPTLAVDLYSLGVVLYELFTGRVPFDAPSFYTLMRMHVEERPLPPIEERPEIPPALSDTIMQLLAKDPRNRPSSAAEVLRQLSAC
jgi:serine/threonine-protein kinase